MQLHAMTAPPRCSRLVVYPASGHALWSLPRCRCRSIGRTWSDAAAAAELEGPFKANLPDQVSYEVNPSTQDGTADKIGDRKPKRKPAPQQTTTRQAGAAAAAGPLPDVLAATFPETFPTLSAARRVIRKDLILVDGQLGSCKTEVTAGQQLQQLEPISKHKAPRTVSLQVLYEDDDVAVVHKPWGVKMYGGDGRRTITGALKAGALTPSKSPDALTEPKPLHRLDAAVGGVLLIAKTATAAADISKQFVERRVHKVYHALLCGQLRPGTPVATGASSGQPMPLLDSSSSTAQDPPQQHQQHSAADSSSAESTTDDESAQSESEDQAETESVQLLPLQELLQRQLAGSPAFTIRYDDLADPVLQPPEPCCSTAAVSSSSDSSSASCTDLGPGVHVVDLPVEGWPSYSLYEVLGYSRSSRYGGWVTSVALSPVTGRKHQLRRHMAALGCPIVGDGKYALNKEEHISNQGIYLEALEIAFNHPSTGQRVHVKMPEPQRFPTMRQQMHNRWKKLSGADSTSDTPPGAASS